MTKEEMSDLTTVELAHEMRRMRVSMMMPSAQGVDQMARDREVMRIELKRRLANKPASAYQSWIYWCNDKADNTCFEGNYMKLAAQVDSYYEITNSEAHALIQASSDEEPLDMDDITVTAEKK